MRLTGYLGYAGPVKYLLKNAKEYWSAQVKIDTFSCDYLCFYPIVHKFTWT